MPVQVFVDESGGKDQGKFFVMAGLMAAASDWASFSENWQFILDAPPRIEYFKTREAMGRSDQFRKMSEKQRDIKLDLLATAIGAHVKRSIHVVAEVEGHYNIIKTQQDFPKEFKSMYYWPFFVVILNSAFDLWDIGLREPFEIIFDINEPYGQSAKQFWPMWVDMAKHMYPEESTILPTEPIFRNDLEFLPLQASDLFAWCLRKDYDGVENHPLAVCRPLAVRFILTDHRSICI